MNKLITKVVTNKGVVIAGLAVAGTALAGIAGAFFHHQKKQSMTNYICQCHTPHRKSVEEVIEELEVLRQLIDEEGYDDEGICKDAITVIRLLSEEPCCNHNK